MHGHMNVKLVSLSYGRFISEESVSINLLAPEFYI
jgi:hypothetical protein